MLTFIGAAALARLVICYTLEARSPGWPEGGMWECWTVLSALADA
jgi:hypothetical protein